MNLVYFGSGSFGLPTLARLADEHHVGLVVTQPDRPAGRRPKLTPTPVGRLAAQRGVVSIKAPDVNAAQTVTAIRAVAADAYIVIAYGQKLGPQLVGEAFAINLHASLLPKYRGAAPVNWAMINGETETGLTVIAITGRIDAGDILARRATTIDPMETAGELEGRLAELGPELVLETLEQQQAGTLEPIPQDDRQACRAPKLTKADGTVRFDEPAAAVQRRVHGLTPWPGCTIRVEGRCLKLIRIEVPDSKQAGAEPGRILADGTIACQPGTIRPLAVQPPGGRSMPYADYARGHPIPVGARMEPL